MANVNIKFNNKDYLLSCDDGQEESLKNLTKFLDRKYGELKEKLAESIPMNRFGSPQDVAEAVFFLSSEKASYITGTVLNVNGGMLMF